MPSEPLLGRSTAAPVRKDSEKAPGLRVDLPEARGVATAETILQVAPEMGRIRRRQIAR